MSNEPIKLIESDQSWLPHSIDWSEEKVLFLRFPAAQFRKPGFLFEFAPQSPGDKLVIPFSKLQDIRVETLPAHFVFHTAFCRSTLLIRALNFENLAVGMSEPGIIAALANAPPKFNSLLPDALRLLSRKRDDASVIFIKPTNHANGLIPRILDTLRESRAILMTSELEPFLASVRKRGLLGHRWGRQLFLETQRYVKLNLGMSDGDLFAMSDLQTSGLAWLLYQLHFTKLLDGENRHRLRTLDANYFNQNRGQTIKGVLEFCQIETSSISSNAIEADPLFEEHSKGRGSIEGPQIEELTSLEIAQVKQWLQMIADQLDLRAPVHYPLS